MTATPHPPDVRVDDGGRAYLWHGNCGRCDPCARASPSWCTAYVPSLADPAAGRWTLVGEGFAPGDGEVVGAALACLDLVAQLESAGPAKVLLLGDGALVLALRTLLADSGLGLIAVADESGTDAELSLAAARTVLSASGGSERADLVISVRGRLDLAAKWVRRGGAVASLTGESSMATLDVIVTREVGVLHVRDVYSAAARLRHSSVHKGANR